MLLSPPHTSLVFKVHRREPELITPATPTPHEFKPLSDIDDQTSLRFQVPVVLFYRNNPSMYGKDPVKAIKEALAKALVFYYPFAGRLREGPNNKFIVECTGEGVLFIEADADIGLDQFGDALQPPFSFFGEILLDVPGSSNMLDCPVLLIQVTRLKCGGFIFAIRLNHTMADGPGLAQFLFAIAEIARGAHVPSILPVWERHILSARNPPRVTCTHHEYDDTDITTDTTFSQEDDLVHCSFFFGPTEISRLRKHAPPHHRNSSTFELLTACLWKCRTIALQFNSMQDVRMLILVNIRGKTDNPLPKGYYGNGFAMSAAMATAGEIANKPFGYALELLKKAKEDVTMEYMKSVADLMVIRDRPHFTAPGTFIVSNLARAGLEKVDFGWGEAVYGGPAEHGLGIIPGYVSFYSPFKNKRGEKGIIVPICLPRQAMKRLDKELRDMLEDRQINYDNSAFTMSRL